MAPDLIPPPSPAGRPERDSSEKYERQGEAGLWATGDRPAVRAGEPAPEPEPAPPPAHVVSPYRPRFGFVLGALIGVALAAVALAALLAVDANNGTGVRDRWSAWQPGEGDTIAVASKIADHVGPRYRDRGDQLVAVRASGLEVAGVELDGIAMRTPGRDIELLEGDSVMYTLMGLGAGGSIAKGKPSEERLLLVKREALELALYTFRYADDVDTVVALLPPSRDAVEEAVEQQQLPPTSALLFRPSELRDRLQIPLTATIPTQTPTVSEFTPDNPEAQTVQALTRTVFLASYQQGQNAKTYLVLDR